MDQGSDWRGDDLPPEELNLIEADKHYGWPYCFADHQIDPIIQEPATTTKATFCPTTSPPGLTVAPDGALLFTDDERGVVYRVSYARP